MDKFSFKMKDRMKLVVERHTANSCTLTVSGKHDTTFSFSKKRAAELIECLTSTLTYGTEKEFQFRKTLKSPAGNITLYQPTTTVEAYRLVILCGTKTVFNEDDIAKKHIKKMVKVMREVYGIE